MLAHLHKPLLRLHLRVLTHQEPSFAYGVSHVLSHLGDLHTIKPHKQHIIKVLDHDNPCQVHVWR